MLDMDKGRSKAVFKQWLAADTVPVIDPFHVVRLAGDALDACRRRVQVSRQYSVNNVQ